MPEIPFALQWTIPEDRLLPLKDSIDNERVFSDTVSDIPEFDYSLYMYPNGDKEENREETQIYLHLKFLNNVKNVEAKWNVLIESADYSFSENDIFQHNNSCGYFMCDTKEFFDLEKKFIVDGKCTIKVNGTFKFEYKNPEIGEQQKWDGGALGDEFWVKDCTKDFRIIVDEKEIKVHKMVLDARSVVFSAMFNPKMKESIEGKVEIPDFSFDVVETAVKMIYDSLCNEKLTVSVRREDDQMSLLQFFDKYNLPTLKDKLEELLIMQISASNVCRLTNCSILTNSQNLKNECMEFMVSSVATQTPFNDIEILDKEITMKILQNSFYKNIETK